MLADKLNTVKEALQKAQTTVSEIVASVPSDHSNQVLSFLEDAVELILQSVNEPSSETGLIDLCSAMISVCTAIILLACSPDLAHINARGVLVNSLLKDLKKVEEAMKTTKAFAMKLEEDSFKLDCIETAYDFADVCLTKFNFLVNECKEIETIIELSNALKIICSTISSLALKVTLKYAWGSADESHE